MCFLLWVNYLPGSPSQRTGSWQLHMVLLGLENHTPKGCFQQELLKLPGREASPPPPPHSLAAQPLC